MKYDYYGKMFEVNLNCSSRDILWYDAHFENEEDREEYNEVLYAIVEREKYLKQKYGVESEIIGKLSKKSMDILKRMFLDRVQDNSVDYLSELDKNYEKYFDAHIKSELSFTVSKPEVLSNYKIVRRNRMVLSTKYFIFNESTGKRTNFPFFVYNDHEMIQVYDYFFIYSNNPGDRNIYDHNFKIIARNVSSIYAVDYKRGYILVEFINDDRIHVFDKNFNEITTFNKKNIGVPKFINDGILAVEIDKRVIYYDYLNGVGEIDNFLLPGNCYDVFGYSDGLYNFIGENGLHGYKDLNGNVVIEPTLKWSMPFLNGVAFKSYVKNLYADTKTHYYLDRTGSVHKFDSVEQCQRLIDEDPDFTRYLSSDYNSEYWDFKMDLSQGAYVAIAPNGARGCLSLHKIYVIDDDTPILEIDFGNNKEFKKVIPGLE